MGVIGENGTPFPSLKSTFSFFFQKFQKKNKSFEGFSLYFQNFRVMVVIWRVIFWRRKWVLKEFFRNQKSLRLMFIPKNPEEKITLIMSHNNWILCHIKIEYFHKVFNFYDVIQWGPFILRPFFSIIALFIIHPRTFFCKIFEILRMKKNDDALDREDVLSSANYKSFETGIVLNWSLKGPTKFCKYKTRSPL